MESSSLGHTLSPIFPLISSHDLEFVKSHVVSSSFESHESSISLLGELINFIDITTYILRNELALCIMPNLDASHYIHIPFLSTNDLSLFVLFFHLCLMSCLPLLILPMVIPWLSNLACLTFYFSCYVSA